MPLPSVSTPFDYLVEQIINDLRKAVDLCLEIKKSRHVGRNHDHTQLNELQKSLEKGPDFITREKCNFSGLPGADSDGADEIARTDFTGYVRQVEEINTQLQNIAYPPTHHPSHHHHHTHSPFFPLWEPPHHKEKEDPHFHTLRLKWENIRDGIPQTFAEMRVRLEKKVKDDAKKKEDEEKAKKEKEELKKKLDAIAEENKKKLKREEKHQEEQIEKQEELQDKRNVVVEKVVKKKLEDDPIEDMDRLAGVMGHIQRVITPRTSHEGIHFNVNSSALGSGMGTGGAGGAGGRGRESPRVIICDHRHDHHVHHHHSHSHHHSPTYSSASSSPRTSTTALPFQITNVNTIHNDEELSEISDIEVSLGGNEQSRLATHPRAHTYVHRHNSHAHGHGERSRSGNRALPEPEIRHGEPGFWYPAGDLVRR